MATCTRRDDDDDEDSDDDDNVVVVDDEEVYQRLLASMTFSGIEGGLRVMDHTHICRTRVSTNHLESQIDFLPFDVLTKQSIGIR